MSEGPEPYVSAHGSSLPTAPRPQSPGLSDFQNPTEGLRRAP